jgi:chromosome segregation ATPase
MDALIQDPLMYWLIWTIATVIGIVLGWSLRASWRERAILQAYEQSEQERASVAHLYGQLKNQHDQKAAEIKRLSLESSHLRQQLAALDLESATRESQKQAAAAQLAHAQAEAAHATEKVMLLEENIRFLRLRDQQFGAEITRLHEEVQGWKRLQRDFSGMLNQIQQLETRSAQLEQERNALHLQLETSKVEISNLQNSLAMLNASAEGDSDQRDFTNPAGD